MAGLRYYARLSISGLFVALFAPPSNQLENFKKLIHLLHQYEIIRIIDSFEMDYFKPLAPRLEYFDFDSGKWNINWKNITVNRVPMEEALLPGMLDINCYACILLARLTLLLHSDWITCRLSN